MSSGVRVLPSLGRGSCWLLGQGAVRSGTFPSRAERQALLTAAPCLVPAATETKLKVDCLDPSLLLCVLCAGTYTPAKAGNETLPAPANSSLMPMCTARARLQEKALHAAGLLTCGLEGHKARLELKCLPMIL